MQNTYDAVVIGAGPAGSTAATLVAKAGRRVLLLDRERFPRFRLGESLMPATYWTFERLGVLDKMHAGNFVEKHSVQFFTRNGKGTIPFYFSEFDDHESSQTWQVDRAEFDKMLVDHAAENGVDVRQGVNVRDVIFDGSRATGVEIELEDGERRTIGSRVVIDCSGQTSLIARRMKLRRIDPVLRHGSIYTRYRGAHRDPGRDEGATLVLHTSSARAWFWYIPLRDDEVSVGVVGPVDELLGEGRTIEDTYAEQVRQCAELERRIEGAERTMPIRAIRDFSYVSSQVAGDGWVLAGDAFGFLDPIYSTGVFLAFKSAEFAADAVLSALDAGDVSAARLGEFGERYLEGMEAMRRLVYAYYDESFHFGAFLKKHPECREGLVDLLVGNVFRKPVQDTLEKMGRMVELPQARTLSSLAASAT